MATAQTNEAGDRHVSIDAVRGFAVLGILLMNIVGMGLPSFAYIDPTYAGGSTGADLWTWAVNNVLDRRQDAGAVHDAVRGLDGADRRAGRGRHGRGRCRPTIGACSGCSSSA